jgi:hypothetical protein
MSMGSERAVMLLHRAAAVPCEHTSFFDGRRLAIRCFSSFPFGNERAEPSSTDR